MRTEIISNARQAVMKCRSISSIVCFHVPLSQTFFPALARFLASSRKTLAKKRDTPAMPVRSSMRGNRMAHILSGKKE